MTDLTLPDRDGLWLLRRVRHDHPALPVVVVSMHEGSRTVRAALEAGARGYLLKTATPEQLLEAVRCAAQGQIYVQPELAGQATVETPSQPPLSLADVELLHWCRRGLPVDAIRERLSLSTPSFESRVRSLCRRLQASDLEAAVARAVGESLLIPDDHGR